MRKSQQKYGAQSASLQFPYTKSTEKNTNWIIGKYGVTFITCVPNFTHANITGKHCRSYHICIIKHKALAQAYTLMSFYFVPDCILAPVSHEIASARRRASKQKRVIHVKLKSWVRPLGSTVPYLKSNLISWFLGYSWLASFPSPHVDVITLDPLHGGANLSFGLILSIYTIRF